MLYDLLNAIVHNPWVLALGTIAFFTIKGILWLVIPFLVIRWRRLAIDRRQATEVPVHEAPSNRSVAGYVTQRKRAS